MLGKFSDFNDNPGTITRDLNDGSQLIREACCLPMKQCQFFSALNHLVIIPGGKKVTVSLNQEKDPWDNFPPLPL